MMQKRLFQSPLHRGSDLTLDQAALLTLQGHCFSPLFIGEVISPQQGKRVIVSPINGFSPLFIGEVISPHGKGGGNCKGTPCFSPLFIGEVISPREEGKQKSPRWVFQSPLHRGS